MQQRRPTWMFTAPLGLCVLLALRCTSQPLDDEQEPAGGSSPADVAFGDAECASCLEGECEEPIAACEAEPGCGAAFECLSACALDDVLSGGECAADCAEGDALAGDLLSCLELRGDACCPDSEPPTGPDAGTHEPELPECAPSITDNSCGTCSKQSCCTLFAGCVADPECLQYDSCVLSCQTSLGGDPVPTAACIAGCEEGNETGLAPRQALVGCQIRDCAPECLPAQRPVDECFTTECPDAYSGCIGDADCWRMMVCATECTSEACWDDCFAQYPGARSAWELFTTCATQCADTLPQQ